MSVGSSSQPTADQGTGSCGRPRRPGKIILIVVAVIIALLATLVIVMDIGVSRRVAVPIQEAWLTEPNRIQLVVDTCNGEPEVTELREGEEAVEVRVVSRKTWGGGGDDCLDLVEIQLEAPLADRLLIDLKSGRQIEVGLESDHWG